MTTTPKIDRFTGPYAFLSNFYIADVLGVDDTLYPSVEHAFQAAKATGRAERSRIRMAESPALAKYLGQRVTLREDWDRHKRDVMLKLLRSKFTRHTALRTMLLDTGDAELIEGNTWNDTYWGVCAGVGENHLGRLLMQVRGEWGVG